MDSRWASYLSLLHPVSKPSLARIENSQHERERGHAADGPFPTSVRRRGSATGHWEGLERANDEHPSLTFRQEEAGLSREEKDDISIPRYGYTRDSPPK